MKSSKLTDKILYLRLKDKDRSAFSKAYDLYIDDIYRFILFKVGGKEEAEDITSGVFLKAWDYVQNNKLGEYNSLKPLLYRIARNAVIDFYRQSRSNLSLDAEEVKAFISDDKQDPEKNAATSQDMQTVAKAMKKLKDEYREIILLKYVNELDNKEIAGILGKSRGNTRVLAYRAINALKKVLEEEQKNQ